MPDGLYERDALAWAERQADLLRRLAAGERLNEPVDRPNVIGEGLPWSRCKQQTTTAASRVQCRRPVLLCWMISFL